MKIDTIPRVIRGEGIRSAVRRANERIEEAVRNAALRARGAFVASQRFTILNVSATPVVPRLGGVQTQLLARMRIERALRDVALAQPGVLELSSPSLHRRKLPHGFEAFVSEALAITGARVLHLEGTDGVPIDALLRFIGAGIRVIVSIHDFSLLGREGSEELLTAASAVIFPSSFLREQYRDVGAEVIEPGIRAARVKIADSRPAIAYAGSVKRHKGGHLLPEIVRLAGDAEWHVFGGGDDDLFAELRKLPNVYTHGYYRAGELPSLLARHRIGLVVLPSIVPESFSLVLSEVWRAGAVAAAFDHGAIAERIRRLGGGSLAPLAHGAEGLAEIVRGWRAGRISARAPRDIATAVDAARATIEVYGRVGVALTG